MTASALFSSATDNWPTPADFYDRLDQEFGFTLDVCSSTANHKAERFYALDHVDPDRRDGLQADWVADARPLIDLSGRTRDAIWMNPPYGRTIGKWMEKAHASAQTGATVVCLVPVRTSSAWWHDWVLTTGAEVRYVRGRLTFGDATSSAPFGSAVVIYRPSDVDGQAGPVRTVPAKDVAGEVVPASTATSTGSDRTSPSELNSVPGTARQASMRYKHARRQPPLSSGRAAARGRRVSPSIAPTSSKPGVAPEPMWVLTYTSEPSCVQ
ncbi:DNA N-6-adenine-methyltransferase [Nocardioides zeicaulis]|uniref:DNA N-6-adenine-methyltransferase n=1 Tax=Nocardioides zeicaulis TaxID=1776857 RepID=A0ABV6E1M7_9ACTN